MSSPSGGGKADSLSIDMGNVELDSAESQLQFKDYSHVQSDRTSFASGTGSGDMLPDDENDILIDGSGQQEKSKQSLPWGQSLIAQYFNVTTEDVVSRITWSIMPFRSSSGDTYMERFIRNNPDIYGPFWISVSLIFSIAIFGNLSSYMKSIEQSNTQWHNDWDIVGRLIHDEIINYSVQF